MGLDQYLMLRKTKSECEFEEPKRSEILAKIPEDIRELTLKHTNMPSITTTVEYEVAYWRKYNALHGWIVEHCADGVDECQPILMEREKLHELYQISIELLLAHKTMTEEDFAKKAAELLPTTTGCFFGSYEYDDYYIDDLKSLAEVTKDLNELLEKPEHKYDEVIYQASW